MQNNLQALVGYNEARATSGKAGAQYSVFAAEAEAPSAGAAANWDPKNMNMGAHAEASLFRAEARAVGVGARLEPNLNTGVGMREGQAEVKALGFGVSGGWRGLGIHTPLGSLGFGKF